MNKLFTAYLEQQGHASSTIERYGQHVKRFICWADNDQLAPETIRSNDLLGYLSYLKKRGVGMPTIQTYLAAITHYYEALMQQEIVQDNPTRYLPLKVKTIRKLHHLLSRQQLENLYTAFDARALRKTRATAKLSAMRNKIATGLMVFQGLDVKVLASLEAEDVDVLGGTIKVKGSRKHNARTLALQAQQIIPIDHYLNQTRKGLQAAFHQEDSRQLLINGYTYYRDAHRRLMQRLRKQEPQLKSVQQIRTSVITHWLKQHNLRETQYLAGHKSVKSTERYQQNDMESLQLDIDRFHPSMGKTVSVVEEEINPWQHTNESKQ